MFRVGIADETLARAGVTHLVEHLALHRQGLADYHFNGATKAAFTHFHVEGAEHEVTAYLNGVCSSLWSLPMDRLETERKVLRTEAAGRDCGQLPLWRHGAQGYGLVSYPEWGVEQLRPEDVAHWAASWFTADNAVLWICGSGIPTGLALKLPQGSRRPAPRATTTLPDGPAYFAAGTGGVLLDSVVPRGTASRLYAGMLERDLFRSLRQEGGLSYTAAAGYERRGDGLAVVTAFADALPEKEDAVLGGFVDVLARFRVGRIEQADLDLLRSRADTALTAPDVLAKRLPSYAEDLLTDHPLQDLAQLRAELWAVTAADVHRVALQASRSALLQVPARQSADWAGFAEAPNSSTHTVTGHKFPSVAGDGSSLVIGPQGVSLTAPGTTATVRYQECAAKLGWPDGGRRLIGLDGLVVNVEPGQYQVDPHTMASIDTAVHPAASVWLPQRQQPRIRTMDEHLQHSAAARSGRPGLSRRTAMHTALLVVCGLAAGLWGLIALAMTFFGGSDPTTSTGMWIGISVFLWLVEALLLWPVVHILRRTRWV